MATDTLSGAGEIPQRTLQDERRMPTQKMGKGSRGNSMGVGPQVYLGKLPVTVYGWGEGRGYEMRQEEPQRTAGTSSLLCQEDQIFLLFLLPGLPFHFPPLPPFQVCGSGHHPAAEIGHHPRPECRRGQVLHACQHQC